MFNALVVQNPRQCDWETGMITGKKELLTKPDCNNNYIIYKYIYIYIMMKPHFKAFDCAINPVHRTECIYIPLMFHTCTVVS